jgi:hypothetical protein
VAALAQQGQQGQGGLPGAEQVDLQRLPDDLEVGGAGLLPGVVVDGGVIDQNIQAAIAAVEVGGDLLGAGWVGDIQPPGQQMPVAGEGGGGLLGLGELAGVRTTVSPRRASCQASSRPMPRWRR